MLAAVFAALFAQTALTARADDISVVINGTELRTENEPVIINDRTLVPMRAVFEALGAQVTWDGDNRRVYASKNNEVIKLDIDSNVMETGIINSGQLMVFSSSTELDVSAQLVGDFTYVPVRAVAEALKSDVAWDAAARRVTITDLPEGDSAFFYASADDYNKLYRVDSNGVNRSKLSDLSVKEVYCDGGYVYYVTDSGYLYRQAENGGAEEQLTDYDTEFISAEDDRVFWLKKTAEHKGELYEYGGRDLGYAEYPQRHRNYLYYNRADDTRMYALNIDTYASSAVEMPGGLTLSSFNCVFYGDYILVENGYGYHNIYRFNADGTNMQYINNSSSFICRNQEEDARVLYVNGDNGQDIWYVWIDGSYNGILVDMPADCAYADVLCQNGNRVYYKNMYRPEIYRTDFTGQESIYVGSGDMAKTCGDTLIISDSCLRQSALDGSGAAVIYGRAVSDYIARDNGAYAIDSGFGNIIKAGFGKNASFVTNDAVTAWADNIG